MEKAVLVTVDIENENEWPAEDRARELKDLARSSGAEVVEEVICRRKAPTPDLFIGKGKFYRLIELSRRHNADIVIFNNDLTPTQLRNLEKGLSGVKVLDRTQLILDIFGLHARSNEGKIQVELAQLEYMLPRLTGRGVELSRLGGGIGTRGPGEKVLEYSRRRIRERIARLKGELKELEKRRDSLRKKRRDAMLDTIAIVGYTNAGKTTLLNALTNSGKLAEDRLFSTLEPVGRVYRLPNNLKVIFHDTVGFLHNLPHFLIESFKATLEEVKEASLLIHVLDASSPMVHEMDEAVHDVLVELGAEKKDRITALNKIDLSRGDTVISRFTNQFNDPVFISARTGEGIGALLKRIEDYFAGRMTELKMEVPREKASLLHLFYENGVVHKREDREDGVYVEATVPLRLKALFDISA